MTLNDFIAPLKKWWWLLVLAGVLAGGVSLFVASRQPPVYQSRARLMIGQAIEDPNPTSGEVYLAQQLATIYANIGNSGAVRDATMEALHMNWLPQYRVAPVPNTPSIEVVVVDTDPERAQRVAQEIANQLILQGPAGGDSDALERQTFVQDQLNTLEDQIRETQNELAALQTHLGELDSALEIRDTQNQIDALQAKLNTLQQNYAGLLATTQRGAINTLSFMEYPKIPTKPTGSNSLLTVGMTIAVGVALAAAGAYLLEYLDKSIKTVNDAVEIIQSPVLGEIPIIPKKDDNTWNFVMEHPRSPVADAFRGLRTNLEFLNINDERKVILVTSPVVSDGKSTVAINLAAIYAQAEKKVFFIDADLRKSMLPEELDLGEQPGLSEYLSGQVELERATVAMSGGDFKLIPPGKFPPNPAELLASPTMDDLLARLREDADVVVVDSPPFIVTDAAILSAKVDGILVVIQPEKTNKDAIKAMMKQLEMVNTPILGVVANRIKKRPGYYTDYYHKEN